jgi:hypothetical protein
MRPWQLVPGHCYFRVSFTDGELQFPLIETLLYVGSENNPEGGRWWYFQPPPPLPGLQGPDEPDDAPTYPCGFSDDQLPWILDFPGLIRALNEVARDHEVPARDPEREGGPRGPQLGELQGQVERFLKTPTYSHLTVVVRFTDDGLALMRRPDGVLVLTVFLRPLLSPQHERVVRTICYAAGLTPEEDYLADRGRTRILSYRIEAEGEAVARICERILLEAYAMGRDDTLTYTFRSRDDKGHLTRD